VIVRPVGRKSDGTHWAIDFREAAHTLVTGSTRSGKSAFAYMALASVAADPTVLVCGLDVAGATLGPFAAHTADPWIALGASDISHHLRILYGLVAEMDRRIGLMVARGVDKLETCSDIPLVLLVIEEFAGEIAAVEAYDIECNARGTERLASRARALIGRLLREGAKVGFRCMAITQRGAADVLGGELRAQFARRVTFRLDSIDSVRMINEVATTLEALQILNADPGVALVWEAGTPPFFARTDLLDYADFASYVRTTYRPKVSLGDPKVARSVET
jgi:DNA segregation ATPase FtsK/SpoIIIE-like protein